MADTYLQYFRELARYNTVANQRLYAACARLGAHEYHKERPGSFGSIHGLLNHILLGDRIWLDRLSRPTERTTTPALDTVLYSSFEELHTARAAEDVRIEAFTATLTADFLAQQVSYVNYAGNLHIDPAPLGLSHMFNHQTHHRGQVHVMLSQTAVKPPNLDLHRILRPDPAAASI